MPGKPTDRGAFFWGLILLAGANGLGGSVLASINRSGLNEALLNSFDVSAIVWISCIAGIVLVRFDENQRPVSKSDLWLGAACLALILLPIGAPSWLAMTILSGWLLFKGDLSASQKKGAIILLATTVPMLWSRFFFQLFAKPILDLDATFVSWLLGTPRTGNMVQFLHGSGYLVIFPACSSLANMSLALLCWVTFVQLLDHKWSRVDFIWSALACVGVMTVNVARMSMMAISLDYYTAIHSSVGEVVANIVFLGIIVGICSIGVRHELFARA